MYQLDYLEELESESIYVLREATSQFQNPYILFSGGKDSITVLQLAIKAFYPSKIPFSLLHVDTGHNFQETLNFRDEIVKKHELNLVVRTVQDSIDKGRVKEENGIYASRNSLQTTTLLDAIEELKIDCCIGGARRDEEKARAKERFFSHRDEFGQWDPKNQRPELWKLFNGRKSIGEHFRVFPISNWTELDVWEYIKREKISLPSLYFSHKRNCFVRDNTIYAHADFILNKESEVVSEMQVRFRTIGDITCTGAVLSNASNVDDVMIEIKNSNTTERGTRSDDKRSETAMEDRKIQGYF